MDIEKRNWDMRKKDYKNVFLRFWILFALVAFGIATAYFLYNYNDKIINKDYTSKIDYQFLYVVKTPPINLGEAPIEKLSDPTIYVDVYKKWYSDLDVLKAIETLLENNMEKEMHFTTSELLKMLKLEYSNLTLTVLFTTKDAEHSQEILKQIKQIAQPRIDSEISKIVARDPSGNIEITSSIAEPGVGINYDSAKEVLTDIAIAFLVVFVITFVLFYGAAIIIYNYNGKFKRIDVFENNYQIPVIGEIVIKMYKE